MTPKYKVDGVQAVLKSMGKARVDDSIAIDQGLQKCAEILLRASQKLVPVDKGNLQASGTVIGNGKKGFAAEWDVSYGGPSAPYAWIVHEDLQLKHEPPTQAKYLTDAINKVRGTMTSVLQRQLLASVRAAQ